MDGLGSPRVENGSPTDTCREGVDTPAPGVPGTRETRPWSALAREGALNTLGAGVSGTTVLSPRAGVVPTDRAAACAGGLGAPGQSSVLVGAILVTRVWTDLATEGGAEGHPGGAAEGTSEASRARFAGEGPPEVGLGAEAMPSSSSSLV